MTDRYKLTEIAIQAIKHGDYELAMKCLSYAEQMRAEA